MDHLLDADPAVKPLFDNNLSDRLPQRLADLYPDAGYVLTLGLNTTDDPTVRLFATAHGFTIVTKDSDFPDLADLLGTPPKVVWVRLGNCSTNRVERAIRFHATAIQAFHADPTQRVFVIR